MFRRASRQIARAANSWRCHLQQQGQRHQSSVPLPVKPAYRVDGRGYERFDSPRVPGFPEEGPGGPWERVPFLRGNRKYVWGVLGACGTAYYVSCIQEVPYTHRKHAVLFITPRMEQRMGKQLFTNLKEEAREAGVLLPDHHPATRMVRRLGLQIARVAAANPDGGYVEHMKNLEWEFAVIKADQVNAFVMPGGKVVVYTKLMEIMDTEDELAAVLAHETGHVVARHHAERMARVGLAMLGSLLFSAMTGLPVPDGIITLAVYLPHSRKGETEADVIGLNLMARACYDPEGNVTMLQKLFAMEVTDPAARSIPKFLRTHPLTKERIEVVQKLLPNAFAAYNMSGCAELRRFPIAAIEPPVYAYP